MFVIGLNAGDGALSGLLPGGSGSLVNARTGEPLTLEAIQADVEWHRETARKLREHR